MKHRILFTAIFLLGFITSFCPAAPKPAIVQAQDDWTLKTVYTEPSQLTARVPGYRKPQRFWYIILTVTNTSDMDVPFYPKAELMTDTFEIISAYKDTRNIVFKQIYRRHKRRFPFLESMETADTRILQGTDQAKDLVIIWPDFDPEAHNITLFIAGLSNETVTVMHPTEKNDDGEPKKIYLRKTLALDYSIAGDPKLRRRAKLVFKDKQWVMR